MFITNVFDLRFLHNFYPGTSKFNVGTGPGMPGCSYATAVCEIRFNSQVVMVSTNFQINKLPLHNFDRHTYAST